MNKELTDGVLEKYPGKVRIIYRDFPITTMHPWALTAARTAQCVYALAPTSYSRFRAAVYEQQNDITSAPNEKLLAIGQRLHLNSAALASCVSSRESLARVQTDVLEGGAVGVSTTPTIFINGEKYIGAPAPELIYRKIDDLLSDLKR